MDSGTGYFMTIFSPHPPMKSAYCALQGWVTSCGAPEGGIEVELDVASREPVVISTSVSPLTVYRSSGSIDDDEYEDEEDDYEEDNGVDIPTVVLSSSSSSSNTQAAATNGLLAMQTEGYLLGDWERHTKGIGLKLLMKMGYERGAGLGKLGDGITKPVVVAVGHNALGAGITQYDYRPIICLR